MPRAPAPVRALVGLAAAVLVVGCSTSYHAGDAAARSWDSWVAHHPLDGARPTDRTGTNVQPFEATFSADAELTATPSEDAIVKAMASMCRFDHVTSASTTYWLHVGVLWLQAPCGGSGQQKMAGFWTAVDELDGYREIDLSAKGMYVEATDEAITGLVPQLSAAADATGRAGASTSNTYRSRRVTITQPHGADITGQLGLVQGALDVAGAAVTAVEAVPGRVTASTSGSVAEARQWQEQVGKGDTQLTVTPVRVSTEVPYTAAGRDLVERLSTDPRVLKVTTIKPYWEITTASTGDARGLISMLDHESAKADLGRLQVDVGPSSYHSADGSGRTCYVRPDFAHPNHAAALLDLCDVASAVEVDDRFDAALDLRLHSTDLRPALACLKRAPYGLPVYLQLPQSETTEFTTGAKLVQKFPEAATSKDVERVWESIPAP
ncbi:MAG: hypothetical protein ACJ72E_01630 [Marmoricola sp.]